MTLVLRYAARSDVGRVRAKNDDSAYVGRHLVVLADGMGGHVGGDVASASTVLDLAPLDAVGYEDPATVLPDEIQNANLILNELVHANPKLAGMGTTCTAALLAGTTLHIAHIGDSRAYRLANGEFSQVTTDHTFVQKLVDEGRLEAGEAPFHPNKNVLMRVLGDVDASPELDVFEVPVAPGERWLFCSDGLTDVVSPEKIHEVLRDSEALNQAVDTLVDLTLKGGAPDNVTVVAFEIAEGTAEELAPVPDVHLSEQALAAAHPPEVGPVSGLLLREDLDARPHLLVGAASNAVRTDRIPVVTRSSTRRRAAALLGETPVPENRPRRTAAVLTDGPDPDVAARPDPSARPPRRAAPRPPSAPPPPPHRPPPLPTSRPTRPPRRRPRPHPGPGDLRARRRLRGQGRASAAWEGRPPGAVPSRLVHPRIHHAARPHPRGRGRVGLPVDPDAVLRGGQRRPDRRVQGRLPAAGPARAVPRGPPDRPPGGRAARVRTRPRERRHGRPGRGPRGADRRRAARLAAPERPRPRR
ncbi:PP2C family protein-serine/threonine phosphatase [Micrococcus luteus]|uniref:PP2C family protein-serine/threonine phosphatase n=1 Tax=Micrococcus luteus TaxID=1270 RepID=UPI001F2594F7|nr:PP2C family serine/threonine-protein phosphatase [Micrococcus luteus]